MVSWEVGNLAPILRHHGDNINTVYLNLFQKLLRNENILNIKIGQYMELSSKLVSAVFPESHRVASFMVYALHPTTFYHQV